MYKGCDRAKIQLRNENDEIEQFLEGRYISPPDAMWHIFGYKMSYSTHNIIRLPVHLENEQTITFNDNDNAEKVIENNFHTQLTAYFLLNQIDKNANEFTYPEIPLHYTFNKSAKRWTRRKYKATKTIVRMYSSHQLRVKDII